MATFGIVTALFMVFFTFFGFAIWFSKHKQEGRACCSTGVEELLGEWDACYTCPKKDTDECNHDHESSEPCANHDHVSNVDSCALEKKAADTEI